MSVPTTLGEAETLILPAGRQHSSDLDSLNWMGFAVVAARDFGCEPIEVDTLPENTPLGVRAREWFVEQRKKK